MKISKINPNVSFQNEPQKLKFTDKFYANTRNSADMNDTVVVPRTIFKGYLGFMAGTTMTALGSLAKNNVVKKSLNVAGLMTCMYGTWAFVRPFVVKDATGVAKK